MAAGHAILTMIVALLVGALLNAPGLHKTAKNQDRGTLRQRSAVVLAGALDRVSHLLHTDRPRQLILDALGREDVDDIVLTLPDPTTPSTTAPPAEGPTETTAPPAEARPVMTPEQPLRMWIAGDSLAQTPGESLTNMAGDTKVIDVLGPVDARVSTGLGRPDVFNWAQHVQEETARLDPHVVVLTFGANDDHGYMTGVPEGTEIGAFGSESWVAEYRRRVGGLMDQVIGEGRTVIWVGIPAVRNEEQSERFDLLNGIYREEAAARAGDVLFVDAWPLLLDAEGRYADYLPNDEGQLVQVRAPDGVHFTRAGGNIIAAAAMRQVETRWDVRSWGASPTTAPSTTTPPSTTTVPTTSPPVESTIPPATGPTPSAAPG
ncbi:MAG: DUF459 domain-containing protein [Acidimicrobiia bacterium]|nr:DUF459 domain-containing protein [Acidimicrobiia bacterium]